MQITVDIPDHLAAQAQARGLVLDDYLAALLARDLETAGTCDSRCNKDFSAERSSGQDRQEAVKRVMQFASKYAFSTGGECIKSMIHEGHKY